jgi:hypothetical protein
MSHGNWESKLEIPVIHIAKGKSPPLEQRFRIPIRHLGCASKSNKMNWLPEKAFPDYLCLEAQEKGRLHRTSGEFPKLIRKGVNLRVVGLILKTNTGAPIKDKKDCR